MTSTRNTHPYPNPSIHPPHPANTTRRRHRRHPPVPHVGLPHTHRRNAAPSPRGPWPVSQTVTCPTQRHMCAQEQHEHHARYNQPYNVIQSTCSQTDGINTKRRAAHKHGRLGQRTIEYTIHYYVLASEWEALTRLARDTYFGGAPVCRPGKQKNVGNMGLEGHAWG